MFRSFDLKPSKPSGMKRNSKIILMRTYVIIATKPSFPLTVARSVILPEGFSMPSRFDKLRCSVPDLGGEHKYNVFPLKTRFRPIGRGRSETSASLTATNGSGIPPAFFLLVAAVSHRVTKARRVTAEIYMFLLGYNQRHGGASLVHHCRVQLCQR